MAEIKPKSKMSKLYDKGGEKGEDKAPKKDATAGKEPADKGTDSEVEEHAAQGDDKVGDDMPTRHSSEREALHNSHRGQHRDLHGNHKSERDQMHKRHMKEIEELAARHQTEMASGGQAAAEGDAAPGGGEGEGGEAEG